MEPQMTFSKLWALEVAAFYFYMLALGMIPLLVKIQAADPDVPKGAYLLLHLLQQRPIDHLHLKAPPPQ